MHLLLLCDGRLCIGMYFASVWVVIPPGQTLSLIAALLLLLAVCSAVLNYVISPGEIHCKYMVYVLHLRSAISMIVYRL